MGFWRKFLNAISADPSGPETVDLNEAKLLEWLGIDSDKPKEISEINSGAYDQLIEAIMQKPIAEMQELYNTRDIEK